MDKQIIIQKARVGFDEDFSKKNYMEQCTGDNTQLKKILSYINIKPHSKILDLGTGSGFLAFPIAQVNSECTRKSKDSPNVHVLHLVSRFFIIIFIVHNDA